MTTAPILSVVIPTCDRNELLTSCLECLASGRQTLDSSRYELIVSDDGKTDTSKVTIEEKFPRVRWTRGPRRGPAANRNHGSHLAEGSWLVFTDDDCLPDREWLESIYNEIEKGDIDVLEGKTIIPDKEDNPFKYGVENLHGGVFWSCNLAIRRNTFVKLGEFDEDFLDPGGEDMELAWRIKKAGLKTRYLEAMLVLHPARQMSFQALLWRTRLNRWKLLYAQKTEQSPPPSTGILPLVLFTAWSETVFLLRTTWMRIRNFDASLWKTQLFHLAWSWLTFPIFLPYQIYWELQFRKQAKS